MLDNHRGIGHQRPEVIGTDSRVALEMIEEGFSVGIIIRI